MTSYPVCNKTSLSRIPCMVTKKLLWNAMRKSWSLFQNPSCKIAWSAPWQRIMMTSYPACNNTSLSRKPYIVDKSYYGTLSGSHDRSIRIRHKKSPKAPPGEEIMMTSYPVGNKTSLSHKPRIADKSYYGTLSGSHGRSYRIRHGKSPETPPGGKITMTSYLQNPSWKIA